MAAPAFTNSNRGLGAWPLDSWWPTPGWVARVLGIYGAAALAGAVVFLVCAALLALFSDPETRKVPTPVPIPTPAITPVAPLDTVNQGLIARATESLKLISVACSAAEDQPAPADQFNEVTYTSLEASKISKALVQGVDALQLTKNSPCIRKSISQLVNLSVNQNLNQVFNLKFFVSQRNGQTLAAAHVDTGVSSAFSYCVSAPQNEQFVPETARLVIDKGDTNSARIAKADIKEVCVSGKGTSSNPVIETHVEVIKITKITVPMPPSTLNCEGFIKNPDGSWTAINPQPFDVGNSKQISMKNSTFEVGGFNIEGIDLAVLLDQKCAARP